jgi:hypothetical protein
MNKSLPSTEMLLTPEQSPFKKWAECHKALKSLKDPVQTETSNALIARINASPHKHYIAFEILCLLLDRKNKLKIQWIEKPMQMILLDGVEQRGLSPLTVPGQAGRWMRNELQDVDTTAKWKEFTSKGKHFRVLYEILRTAPNTHILVEALAAFTDHVEHLENISQTRQTRKLVISASDARWIAKLLKSKIPTKNDLPKSFFETTFAIIAAAALSENIRAECNALHLRLKEIEEKLDTEAKARAALQQHEKDLRLELEAISQSLENTRKELSEEKLHTARQGGFNLVAKRETINHVLSVVRQGISHRLENIRRYADRDKPNREEIVALVAEIEKHIIKIEEKGG